MTKPETKRALREALALARGEEVEGHLALLARLQDPSFLSLLDSEEDYQRAMQFRLRVAQVLEALGKNPAPTARHVLVELTGSEPFLAEEDRVLALVRASAYVRPPPPPLLDLWDRYSQPDDGFTPTTIPVLATRWRCSNASSSSRSTTMASSWRGCTPRSSPIATTCPCS